MKLPFKPWIPGIALLVFLILFGGFYLSLGALPASQPASWTGEVAMTVLPAPTSTPTSPSVVTPTATPAPPSRIQVSTYVRIQGTGGAGLRLRVSPSLQADINFLGQENEVFLVIDGPEQADGYTWWHLEAPDDPTRNGWAVTEYLELDAWE